MEDQLRLGIKHKKGILSHIKQAGFPYTMPKYRIQLPGFRSLKPGRKE